MGSQTNSQVDAIKMQVAKKPLECSLHMCLYYTCLRPACVNLHWVAKMVENVHSLAYKFELDQIKHSSSQAHNGHGQTVLQVLAITCNSVWPGPKVVGLIPTGNSSCLCVSHTKLNIRELKQMRRRQLTRMPVNTSSD